MSREQRREQKGYLYRRGKAWFVRYCDDVLQSDGTIKRKQVSKKLDVPYSDLMTHAGYVVPNADAQRVREGAVLEYALSSERLSDDEANALLEYLDWYRHRKATSARTSSSSTRSGSASTPPSPARRSKS